MNMKFDTSAIAQYNSKSQIIRVMSENWVAANMYCPCCGHDSIRHLTNNLPAADMQCDNCGEIFELKSKKGKIGKKIAGSAFDTTIQRINSITNPNLLILQYTQDYSVSALTLIPKFFFVPSIIEKRKPLGPNARRAGWVGSNILFTKIPDQGRIPIITDGQFANKEEVVNRYRKVKVLRTDNIESRGWMFDVLNCVNRIASDVFDLKDIYAYADVLKALHPDNNNIEPKIRQQLQVLRDKGFIEFLSRGRYKKAL